MELQTRGTRLLIGKEAFNRRKIINTCIDIASKYDFSEIFLPSIEPTEIYTDKAGDEVLNQMYTFQDKKGRNICLRPEGTATCQLLADSLYKPYKNIKLWYETKCWRYERPQEGRYREFTQFGVEILNPNKDYTEELIKLGEEIIKTFTNNYEVCTAVKRGLSYYTDNGFEIICPDLGAQKQVLGGGSYKEGIGFALGIDRLMLV